MFNFLFRRRRRYDTSAIRPAWSTDLEWKCGDERCGHVNGWPRVHCWNCQRCRGDYWDDIKTA